MINRVAIILRYKEPFIKWANESDPCEDSPEITLENTNDERTVYLISDRNCDNIDGWISRNFKMLFEDELEDWYTDESLWPKKRDRKTFNEWFDVEYHTVIRDIAEGPIEDDEI